tara:strand:- start:21228 stop:22991 length:1764 start_codon:yes stop_codon:yes gene_type:complete
MHSKILKLQKEMKKNHMDGYILPCTDEYLNEYVPNVKNRLKWLTNFTGSNGICFILRRKLLFFTDGRYILQSKKELSEKFNIFDTSKINIFDWVTKNIKEKKFKISVDMKINSIFFIEKLIDVFKETNNKLILNKNNFIDNIFNNIENKKSKNLFFLSERYSGEKATSKIKRIKEILKDYDLVIFTSPESIAWLLNIRGGDLEHTPLVFCRLLIKKNKLILFINKKKINNGELKVFEDDLNIKVESEHLIGTEIKKSDEVKNIFINQNSTFYFKYLAQKHKRKITVGIDPCILEKSKKNEIEIKSAINMHILDGVALVKFLCWLDLQTRNTILNEVIAAEKLKEFRMQNENFISLSFPTISAFGANGAIIHYSANNKNKKKFRSGEIFLCDSGAQYLGATTDVTRTIFYGNKNKILSIHKETYTRVLKGHLKISKLIFPRKTKGYQIDALARESLWSVGYDYEHGTGHGVGSFLSVHEGPQSISKVLNNIPLLPGMILSNEPGFYLKDRFGIRIENLICVQESKLKNYLHFRTLTLAPYELSLIDKKLLNRSEIDWLNNYHEKVFRKLKNHLNYDEQKWLKKKTSKI